MSTHLESVISALPDSPGVYQFYDKDNKLLYIGKAKSLRKRVVSYFRDDANVNGKTRIMVRKISDVKTLVVDSEMDALLLENNLIKNISRDIILI